MRIEAMHDVFDRGNAIAAGWAEYDDDGKLLARRAMIIWVNGCDWNMMSETAARELIADPGRLHAWAVKARQQFERVMPRKLGVTP